jgi:hypothetical protein
MHRILSPLALSSRVAKILLLVAVAFALIGTYAFVSAQDSDPAPPPALTPHTLKTAYFDTNSVLLVASCNTAHCTAITTPFTETIKCPAVAGKTCTFQVTIESANNVQNGSGLSNESEDGIWQFLVDGSAPIPGPTNSQGLQDWFLGPTSLIGTSYAVTATVKNTVSSQSHNISVGFGCKEVVGDPRGCIAQMGFANLQIAVFTP